MQILSLKHENKILVKSLRKRDEGRAGKLSHGDKASCDFTAENKEALSSNSEVAYYCLLSSNFVNLLGSSFCDIQSVPLFICSVYFFNVFQVEMTGDETVMDSTETVRNIDARQLKLLDILKVILVLIIPIIGYYFYQYQVV